MSQAAGTYTFVFTDIEGSTRLLRALGSTYAKVLAEHDGIVRNTALRHGGRAFGSEGDAQHLVFEEAGAAIAACVQAQRELEAHAWPEGRPVRVRMGVHAGRATIRGDDFNGLVLHETARISSAGHGGQVLVSAAARELARDELPAGVTFRDLGQHRFKDIDEPMRIFQLDIAGLETQFPPLRSRGAGEPRLPAMLTGFVGRDEVEAVQAALGSARLVTLTGPGGTGKTRLSIEVAAAVAPEFEDGTFFVALDALMDPDLVPARIASTIGLTTGSDAPIERLVGHLAERSMLLVLDNLEQIVEAGPVVARLVRECPGVRVLATSRIPLRVYGEVEFPVPALSLPPTDAPVGAETALRSEAVRLFVERARAARPGFGFDDDVAPAVVDVVSRLDGLPLAIELAAARLRSLPLEGLRSRLDDRLSTLTGGARDVPGRQRTLRAAIDWSHGLLEDADRRLFARFGIFAGSPALPQVEAVCGPADELGGDVLEGLESLNEQSLLKLVDDGGADPRFGMLATIREYARERASERGETEMLRRRHAEAYLGKAEEAAPHLLGPEGRAWNERLERDHDDLRAALDWAEETGHAEVALRFLVALWRFWQVRGHLHEGKARAERVLALEGVETLPPDLVSRAESAAGGISYWRSDPPATHAHYAAALRHARASGDKARLAEALYDQGFAPGPATYDQLERYRDGKPYFQEALALYRELGDRAGEASALWALQQSAQAENDSEAAERLAMQTLEISRELGDPFRIGWAAFTLAVQYAGEKRFAEARTLLAESLGIFVDSGDQSGILLNLGIISYIGILSGVFEDGWRLFGAARRLKGDTGADLLDENIAFSGIEVRPEPTTEEELSLVAEGRSLSTDQAIELALTITRTDWLA